MVAAGNLNLSANFKFRTIVRFLSDIAIMPHHVKIYLLQKKNMNMVYAGYFRLYRKTRFFDTYFFGVTAEIETWAGRKPFRLRVDIGITHSDITREDILLGNRQHIAHARKAAVCNSCYPWRSGRRR